MYHRGGGGRKHQRSRGEDGRGHRPRGGGGAARSGSGTGHRPSRRVGPGRYRQVRRTGRVLTEEGVHCPDCNAGQEVVGGGRQLLRGGARGGASMRRRTAAGGRRHSSRGAYRADAESRAARPLERVGHCGRRTSKARSASRRATSYGAADCTPRGGTLLQFLCRGGRWQITTKGSVSNSEGRSIKITCFSLASYDGWRRVLWQSSGEGRSFCGANIGAGT